MAIIMRCDRLVSLNHFVGEFYPEKIISCNGNKKADDCTLTQFGNIHVSLLIATENVYLLQL